MFRPRVALALVVLCVACGVSRAADQPLLTAVGLVEKAGRDTVTIRPRGPEGRFQKGLTLRVTGTSKLSILIPQNRAGRVVLTQRDLDPGDLAPNQTIAVIYTPGASGRAGAVLLAAVVQPAAAK